MQPMLTSRVVALALVVGTFFAAQEALTDLTPLVLKGVRR
jgi:hypothetical protein